MFHLEASAIIYMISCISHMWNKTYISRMKAFFSLWRITVEEQMWPPWSRWHYALCEPVALPVPSGQEGRHFPFKRTKHCNPPPDPHKISAAADMLYQPSAAATARALRAFLPLHEVWLLGLRARFNNKAVRHWGVQRMPAPPSLRSCFWTEATALAAGLSCATGAPVHAPVPPWPSPADLTFHLELGIALSQQTCVVACTVICSDPALLCGLCLAGLVLPCCPCCSLPVYQSQEWWGQKGLFFWDGYWAITSSGHVFVLFPRGLSIWSSHTAYLKSTRHLLQNTVPLLWFSMRQSCYGDTLILKHK